MPSITPLPHSGGYPVIEDAIALSGRNRFPQKHLHNPGKNLCHHTGCRIIDRVLMDLLIVAILIASAILVYVLLRGRDRYSPDGKREESLMPPVTRSRNPVWPMSTLEFGPQTRAGDAPIQKPYRLLNDAEQILYFRLCEAMPRMLIFAQVGVAQLAQLRGRREARKLSAMLGRGVDFVVCGSDFRIMAAIDLAWLGNDGGQNSPEEEKRRALQSLGIPLIVYRPNQLPDPETLSKEVTNAIVHRKHLEDERSSLQ